MRRLPLHSRLDIATDSGVYAIVALVPGMVYRSPWIGVWGLVLRLA